MQLIWALVMLVVSYTITALTTKHTQQTPAKFTDFTFPQATEGTPQAVVFGDVWCEDWFVLWAGNYRSTPIRKGSKGK